MHVFPQLRKLEHRYPGELAVVGVHSAKFEAERATENIRDAVMRYEVEHPVINDKDFRVWQQYSVRAWPTLYFIDPEGKVIGKHEGEIPVEELDRLIADMIRQFDERGLVDRMPADGRLERDGMPDRPLMFPGKVLADAASGRLFVADSNHHRIVVSSLGGEVVQTIGSGEARLADGPSAEAAFNDPQGMVLDGDTLYVADTKSHAIRAIDLEAQTVATLAGTGEQSRGFHRGGPGPATALNSPWDLTLHNGTLFIAMAGFHQLWRMDLATHEVRPHAGSGRESIVDGPMQSAQLAQPSGIATDGRKLYFADSETSSIRTADLSDDGHVTTIVGLDLFTFGDVDGTGDSVRLQHPIGLDLHDETLYVADTYNNKIKTIRPESRTAETLAGSGSPGCADGPAGEAEFREPAGLSVAGGRLYVSDTNNHAIRVVDLATKEVTTLSLEGI